MNYREVIDELTKSVQESISKIKYSLNYDVTFKARIEETAGGGKYHIRYRGQRYSASSSIPCAAGDYVRVCAPQNNWNDLFITAKVTGLST